MINPSFKQCENKIPKFKWSKTLKNTIPPYKNRFSDSGFDLSIVKLIKQIGNVYYYDTGIQIEPENGYYFELVGLSSISKTGWMLVNGISIIDSWYRGSIQIALIKIDPSAPDLEMPKRIVQLIPRQLILMDNYECEKSSRVTDRSITNMIIADRSVSDVHSKTS